jgi:tetratricopeptide (TPR) repeat protein
MRTKIFIGLIIIAIIGSGDAAFSAGAAQDIQRYWKPSKPIRLTPIGIGLYKDVPLTYQKPEDVLFNKGVEFLTNKKFSQAISEFDQLIIKHPRCGDAYYSRGLALALDGKYAPAIADFTHYLGLDPKDADSYCNRGLARVLLGQYDQGLSDLNKALELTPNDPLALYLRGFAQFKQGRADPAKADYEKALRLKPDFWEREGKGQTELDTYPLILQGKAPALAGPAGTSPEGAAHKRQALAAAQKGDYDKALAEFTQAIQADPKDPELYNNRGSMYTFKGQYDQAIADFNQALKLNPRYANAYYNRGVAYYNKSLYDKAIGDFTKCLELDPKLADAYFSKALALEAAGRKDEAREAYTAFLRHASPEAKDQIEQARRSLQK